MNLLHELLIEARDEILQEAWDRTLLSAFRSGKYPMTGLVCDRFEAEHRLDRQTFHKLKRVPRYGRHFTTRIPRFIAAYLPALNDKLHDSKLSDDELILWMRRVKLDTESSPADKYKSSHDFRLRKLSDQRLAVNTVEYIQRKTNGQLHGRNWTTHKPVRSKS